MASDVLNQRSDRSDLRSDLRFDLPPSDELEI